MSSRNMLRYVLDRLPAPGDREGLETLSKAANVPYHTLLKIAKGQTEDPRVSTVQNLYDHLSAIGKRVA